MLRPSIYPEGFVENLFDDFFREPFFNTGKIRTVEKMNTDIKEFQKAVHKTIKQVICTPKIADVRSRIVINPNDYYTNDPYAYLYKNLEWCELVKE